MMRIVLYGLSAIRRALLCYHHHNHECPAPRPSAHPYVLLILIVFVRCRVDAQHAARLRGEQFRLRCKTKWERRRKAADVRDMLVGDGSVQLSADVLLVGEESIQLSVYVSIRSRHNLGRKVG